MPGLTDEELRIMCEAITPDQCKEELLAAGWKKVRNTLWQSPNGDHYFGPFGAWREMKRREDRDETE